jgi:hypothetical protein
MYYLVWLHLLWALLWTLPLTVDTTTLMQVRSFGQLYTILKRNLQVCHRKYVAP